MKIYTCSSNEDDLVDEFDNAGKSSAVNSAFFFVSLSWWPPAMVENDKGIRELSKSFDIINFNSIYNKCTLYIIINKIYKISYYITLK